MFRSATETDIIESIIQLNNKCVINEVLRKIMVMYENYFSDNLKELFHFCMISGVYQKYFFFQIAEKTSIQGL